MISGRLKTFRSSQWSEESNHFLCTPLVWIIWLHTVITSVFHPFPSPPVLCFSSLPHTQEGQNKKTLLGGVWNVKKLSLHYHVGCSGGLWKLKGVWNFQFFTVQFRVSVYKAFMSQYSIPTDTNELSKLPSRNDVETWWMSNEQDINLRSEHDWTIDV